MSAKIHGVLPVVQLPLHKDETIDRETLRREVDWLYGHGVDGVTMGMVSETVRLTEADRDGLAADLVEFSAGRGPVIASVGGESTRQTIRNAVAAECAGAAAVMTIPPTLSRPTPEALRQHFRTLLKAISIPVIIQDASGYLGNAVPLPLQVELWREFPNRVLFKPEGQPIGQQISKLREFTADRAVVFDGMGGSALAAHHSLGVHGVMPGSDLAWAIVALWRALNRQDYELADRLQGPIAAITVLQTSLGAFLAMEKMLLVEQGVFSSPRCLDPLEYCLDDNTRRYVLRQLQQLQKVISTTTKSL